MNLVDVLIIAVLISAVLSGLQHGFLKLSFSLGGFLVGLLAGSYIARLVIGHISDPALKLLFLLMIELFLAFSLSFSAEVLALKLSHKAKKIHAEPINQWLGAVFEILSVLIITWLVASGLANVRSYNIGQQVHKSFIVRNLDTLLPPPPDFIARLEKIVSPNGFPDVFIGLEPQHTTISPNNKVNDAAVLKAERSVVKIQGTGCGGIIFGSGFVADKGIVVTNAHVVAGVRSPQVVDSERTYRATPIWFDPNLDLAILQVNSLPDDPLPLAKSNLDSRDAAVILGFPGGGPLVADRGVIIDQIVARGQNIYNQGVVFRSIYEIQGEVERGNSGGPIIGPDGSVAGVVFAKSITQDNIGYALVLDKVKTAISQAEASRTPVSTRSCAED